MHARVSDHAGLPKRLRWRSGAHCLPLHRQRRHPESVAAQWLACTFPYRRFADILTAACARLGADVVRYSFIVVDLHHLLLAGLPAHLCENAMSDATVAGESRRGIDRTQVTLFPARLDEYVAENAPHKMGL